MTKKKAVQPETQEERKLRLAKEWVKVARKLKKIPSHSDLNQTITRNMIRGNFGDMTKLHDYIAENLSDDWEEVNELIEAKKLEAEKERESVARKYVDFAKQTDYLPSERTYVKANGKDFLKYFSSFDELELIAMSLFPDEIGGLYSDEDFLDIVRRGQTRENINKHTRIVTSSIGSGPVMRDYLNSILHYCEKNDGRLVLQCTDIKFHEIDREIARLYFEGVLDIAVDNLSITENIELSNIRIKEKVVDPKAGIQRRAGHTSYVFASPKQTFQSLPSKKMGHPRFLMSSGAITKSRYYKDSNRPHKREVMADNDHIMGAIIIEKEGNLFFSRQTQMSENFGFMDWGMEYMPDGKTVKHVENIFNMGDLHSAHKHQDCFTSWLKVMRSVKASKCLGQDMFDAVTVNPHEANNPINHKINALEGHDTLVDELKTLADDIQLIKDHVGEVVVVESNHDDMLDRSFVNKSIFKDSKNSLVGSLLEIYAVISKMRTDYDEKELLSLFENLGVSSRFLQDYYPMLGKRKPLIEVALNLVGLETEERIRFLSKEHSYVYGGFQLSNHGDKGVNGARGSISSFARVIDKMQFGHTHTPTQQGWVSCVGHTEDNPRYARGGFSSWCRTSSIIYKNGTFQFVHYVMGRVRSFKKAYLLPEIALASKELIEKQKYDPRFLVESNRIKGMVA